MVRGERVSDVRANLGRRAYTLQIAMSLCRFVALSQETKINLPN
jgi:hypothetical protein